MYISIILALYFIMAGPAVAVGSSGDQFTDDDFTSIKSDRPAINEDFDPDKSCLFDAYQLKCVPGANQECPRPQFGNNDDSTCFPKTLVDGEYKWVCPDDYHNIDEDESGQCYPNDEECPKNYVFEKGEGGEDSNTCQEYKLDCDLNKDHHVCNGQQRDDGIMVCDEPDHPGFKFCD